MWGLAGMDPFDEACDLLGDHIGFEVDTAAGAKLAEESDFEGMRNEQDFERYALDLVHRQADAVDGDGAFLEKIGRDVVGGGHAQGEGARLLTRALDPAGAVDMAADHVSAKGIAQAQGGFQVHVRAGAKAAFDGAKVYARLATGGDPEGMAAYLTWCGFLARRAVERNWDRIGRFARRLADAGELEGRELKKALTSASWTGPACSRWQA